jgi:hypothetical protein
LAASLVRSTHQRLQIVSPLVLQVAEQAPKTHAWPDGHACPHVPQLSGSAKSTHVVPQSRPTLQVHVPFVQDWPVPQAAPHLPQLFASLCRSTHSSPHSVSGILVPGAF